jgi:hypothetical protein
MHMRYRQSAKVPLLIFLFFFCAQSTKAEVVDSTANGFAVKSSVTIIGSTPDEVYSHMVKDVGKWWNSAHSWSGDARNLSIDDKAGGVFAEKLKNGGSVLHLTVVFADPGKVLRMTGGLGPLQSLAVAGSMSWSLTKIENGTTVEFSYTVGGYRPGGLASLAVPVDNVLSEQLTRFKNFVEKGKPE